MSPSDCDSGVYDFRQFFIRCHLSRPFLFGPSGALLPLFFLAGDCCIYIPSFPSFHLSQPLGAAVVEGYFSDFWNFPTHLMILFFLGPFFLFGFFLIGVISILAFDLGFFI